MLTIGHRTPEGELAHTSEVPQFGLGTFLMKESGLCRQACLWALEAGYRHIDTAKVYENEVEVGEALAECGIERSEVFVTTKLRSLDATSHDAVLEHCQASLERLGLEQVDLYLVHAPPPDIDCRAEVWRGMETCLENGWTRAIGVSNYGRHHLDALMEAARYGPSVNQVEIHPWLQRPDLIAATLEVGAVPMAYSPLARGHKVEDPQLAKIADAIGCTPAQAALKWCMDQGYITIPKSSNEQRIAENIAALDVDIAEQSDALDALEENYISGWDPTTEP
jgi:diketogulonate reductase-like aldo/keto reductase